MLFDTSSSISGVDKEYIDDLISKIKLKQGTPGLDSRNIELRKGEGNLEWRYSTKLNNLVDFKSDFVKAIVNKEDVVKKLLIQSDTPNAEYVQIKTVTVFGIDEQGNLVASLNPSINTAPPGKKFEYFGGFDPTRGAIELSANTEIDGDMSIQNVVNNIVPAFQDETIVDISEIILNVYLLDSEMNELKRVKVNYVINKTTNNNWNTLVNLSELKGQRGEKGEPGTPADLSDYYTRAETDNKISQEIANAQLGSSGEVDLSSYATKEELKGKANVEHSHSNYSDTNHNHNTQYATISHEHETYSDIEHNHDGLYAVKSSEHNHINKVALDKINDSKITEWNNKANSNHTHDNYSPNTHNHDEIYATKSHSHEGYANSEHNHNTLYAVKSSEHTHTNKTALDKVTDTKINEWNGKANASHTHDNYSETTHNHDLAYAGIEHTHDTYSLTSHNHDNVYAKKTETYTKLETDSKIAEEISKVQIGGEVDLSAYATKEDLKGKADKSHTHSNYSDTNHNHDNVYASVSYVNEQIQNIELIPGVRGEQGFGWLFGETEPVSQGRDGDLYYKYNTYDVYRKTGGTWEASGNLKGAKGEKGEKGDKGDKGEPGSNATVEVVDNLTSSSTTGCLSANQGKVLNERINEVFQSVSSGKQLIASAITDKGVETSNTDTFEQMATNIGNIQAGGGSGSLTPGEIEEAEYWKTETNWDNRFSYDKRTRIPKLRTGHVVNMSYTFADCYSLTRIEYIDTTSVADMTGIFYGDSNLTHIRFNPNTNNIADFDISMCTKMTKEDVTGMFESLPTISTSRRIILGSTLLNKLTEEDKLIATNKGYTLA